MNNEWVSLNPQDLTLQRNRQDLLFNITSNNICCVCVLCRLVPAVAVSAADEEALGMVRGLAELSQRLPPLSVNSSTPATLVRAARELQPLLPALLPGLLHTGTVQVKDKCTMWERPGTNEDLEQISHQQTMSQPTG